MRVILHNGMTKTGTTALQMTLLQHKRLLLENGILYPTGERMRENHNILATSVCSSYKHLPRMFKPLYKDNLGKKDEDFRVAFRDISEAAKSASIHTVILSAESLFRPLESEQIKTLSTALRSIGDSVEVITYVRHPAEHYLSAMHQRLKASSKLPPLMAARSRPQIESYAEVADTQTVVPYDRAALQAGDITHDFFHRVLPGHTKLLEQMRIREHNATTVSAEGLDILQRYIKYVHPEMDNVFTWDIKAVRTRLQYLDLTVEGYSRPRLAPDVYRTVCRSAIDLPWLLSTYGIKFENIDYDQEFRAPERPMKPTSVDQVCHVNQERRDRLLMLLVQQLNSRSGE